jgi:NAD(P)H-hydrate epimerase
VRSLAHARARGARIVADAGALGVVPAALVDVATPHPGEAARLLGCTTAAVQRDRRAAAHALVERCGSVVVLKGAAPVVATASRAVVVAGAVPSLAVAGSGDVLAGVLGAVLGGAWGDALPEVAAVAAVELHQRAGRRLARGARAGEIADAVAVVVAEAGAR